MNLVKLSQPAEELLAVCIELTKHKMLKKPYRIRVDDFTNSVTRLASEACSTLMAGRFRESAMLRELLNSLAHDLNDLQKDDPKTYRVLAHRLRAALGKPNFHGTRWELAMATHLKRQGQVIAGLDRPDLQLAGGFAIECGSARITANDAISPERMAKKVRSVVAHKDGKAYANSETALFIDATNLAFLQVRSDSLIERETFAEAVYHASERYGAVLLHFVIDDTQAEHIRQCYLRFDRKGIGQSLLGYLDRFYNTSNPLRIDQFTAFSEQS